MFSELISNINYSFKTVDLGYTDNEELFVHRTLETARLKHPNIHFQRFAANDIMEDVSPIESDIKVIAEMEENVKDYVINTPRVRNTTFETMKRLFASEPRSFSTSKENDHHEAADKIMADMGKSVAFQQRQRLRASVAHSHFHPKSRFEFAKSVLGFGASSYEYNTNLGEDTSTIFESDEASTVEQFSEEFGA